MRRTLLPVLVGDHGIGGITAVKSKELKAGWDNVYLLQVLGLQMRSP
jgi:hypothetical protein